MLPASNRGAGGTVGFPDVCNTPVGPATVPIPYPNFGLNAMAAPFSPNIFLGMIPALNLLSIIPLTNGDQAGLAHPTIMGPASFLVGCLRVFINLLPSINLTTPSTGNSMNNPLGAVLIPSISRVFFTHRAAGAEGGDAMSEPPGARLIDDARAGELRLDACSPREVKGAMLGEGVGYLDLPAFSAALPTRAARAIKALERAGLRHLVIDLRDNPGGDVSAFARFASDFLPSGSVLAWRRDADGDEIPLRAQGDGPSYRFDVTLLVNRWTASAAELFAGCLRWHGRAAIVGERTYGKGVGRAIGASPSGYAEVDVAWFALPGGEAIHGEGLSPDIPAPGERPCGGEADQALDAARALSHEARR